jgi:hypothetical protein
MLCGRLTADGRRSTQIGKRAEEQSVNISDYRFEI